MAPLVVMHSGRLPRLDSLSSLSPPSAPPPPAASRRRFLAALVGVLGAGCGTWWLLHRLRTRSEPSANDAEPPRPARGTLEWASSLLDAPVDAALASAGDFERVVARHARESRLVPVAGHILDLALVAEVAHADAAAACAIRALDLLGEQEQIRKRAPAIKARGDLARANQELAFLLATSSRTNR